MMACVVITINSFDPDAGAQTPSPASMPSPQDAIVPCARSTEIHRRIRHAFYGTVVIHGCDISIPIVSFNFSNTHAVDQVVSILKRRCLNQALCRE